MIVTEFIAGPDGGQSDRVLIRAAAGGSAVVAVILLILLCILVLVVRWSYMKHHKNETTMGAVAEPYDYVEVRS